MTQGNRTAYLHCRDEQAKLLTLTLVNVQHILKPEATNALLTLFGGANDHQHTSLTPIGYVIFSSLLEGVPKPKSLQ